MSRLTSKLKNKVEVFTKNKVLNELGIYEYEYTKLKDSYMQILPKSSKITKGEADTEKVESTHIFKCRVRSIPDLDNTYRLKYKDLTYEVTYFDYDFKDNEFFEIYTRLVIE